jgi:hypothetical protein
MHVWKGIEIVPAPAGCYRQIEGPVPIARFRGVSRVKPAGALGDTAEVACLNGTYVSKFVGGRG